MKLEAFRRVLDKRTASSGLAVDFHPPAAPGTLRALSERLGFDLRRRNDAEQWDILNVDTGFRVTLTMASFWSNKVLAWVDKRRAVWEAWAPPA